MLYYCFGWVDSICNTTMLVDFFIKLPYTIFIEYGPIAQLVEQRLCKAKVRSSNLLRSTTLSVVLSGVQRPTHAEVAQW